MERAVGNGRPFSMAKLYLDTAEGVVEHLVFDDADRKIHLQRTSDVTANIEQNKREFNDASRGRDGLGDKVASIPMGVALTWLERYGVDVFNRNHWPAVKRLLNDPEWRYLRTAPGHI